MTAERRSRFRRPPALHRPPAAPAPVTPDEVLERAPDVSRETFDAAEDPPPLLQSQILKLEALTAIWERQVRLEVPADATMLYASPRLPPVPPARPALTVVSDDAPAPVPDPVVVAERTAQLLAEEAAQDAAEQALEEHRPPAPAPAPAPGGPGPVRVSDWVSRHDPQSLEYPVRQRLARAVPIADVSLDAGPVLDQGTTPPLSARDASACVGMACAAAANVLYLGRNRGDSRAGFGPLHEDDARKLYARAQDLDAISGHDYAGTSVLAGLKAGQEEGLWDGYLWALGGTKDIAQVLLQLRVAVVVGIPWSTGLEEPDRFGVITPGGSDAGGHALAVVGLRQGMLGGRPGPWFELQQSRGYAEGNRGRVYMHHTWLRRLLGGIGEAGVPLPAELLR